MIPYEELHRLYVVEGRNVLDTARALKMRNDVVLAALHHYGLVRAITYEWLFEEYVTKERDVDDLAAELRLDESSVRYHLRKFGIDIRYKKRGSDRHPLLSDRAWLEEHYCVKQLSIRAIAEEAGGASPSSVVNALRRFEIPSRLPHQIRKPVDYRFQFTTHQRAAILKRDNHRCRYPECTVAGGRLEAHHIKPRHEGGTNALTNGITLCRTHHQLTYGCEEEYEELFLSLVQEPSA